MPTTSRSRSTSTRRPTITCAAGPSGCSAPRFRATQRRWAGVYSQVTTSELYHRSQVAPGVVLVTGPGGRGMTCSPAIAEDSFDSWNPSPEQD